MTTRSMTLRSALTIVALMAAGSHTAFAQGGAQEKQPSLYDRLGGLAPISVVVSDFIDALVPDSVLNANPAIDAARKRVPAAYLKYHVTALVCLATGGPCQYQGRAMKESHAHLNITEPRLGPHGYDLHRGTRQASCPGKGDAGQLLAIVGSTKADMVASGTGEQKEGPVAAASWSAPPLNRNRRSDGPLRQGCGACTRPPATARMPIRFGAAGISVDIAQTTIDIALQYAKFGSSQMMGSARPIYLDYNASTPIDPVVPRRPCGRF